MTSPEAGSTAPAVELPDPEKDLEALKGEVAKMTTEAVLNSLTSTEGKAEDIESINEQSVTRYGDGQIDYKGSLKDPDSYLSQAKQVKKAVQIVLLTAAGKGPPLPDVQGVQDPDIRANAQQITKDVLKSITEKINIASITDKTAPYYHRLLRKLFKGSIRTVEDLGKEFDELSIMAVVSPAQYGALRNALAAVARDRGRKEFEINQMFKTVAALRADPKGLRNQDYTKERTIREIFRDKQAVEMELEKLYDAFETAADFDKYYSTIHAKYSTPEKLVEYKAYYLKNKPNATPQEQERYALRFAKEQATKEVQRKLIYLVNLFYKPVLSAAPNKRFREVVSDSSGPLTPNPDNLFNNLKSRIAAIATANLDEILAVDESKYMGFHQETSTIINPERREQTVVKAASKEFKEVKFDTFIKQLETIITTERNVLEYGHDFRFATSKGPQGDKGFFMQIAQYAKESIESADLDIINTIAYSELVQSAKIQLEKRYKIAFAQARWRRDIRFLREVFEDRSQLDRDIRENLLRDFVENAPGEEGKYPEIVIDRCLAHAKTIVFGKEFMLHLMASYADPRLEHTGKPTYSREELAGAAVFQPAELSLRWSGGQNGDLDNNNEVFLPVGDSGFFEDVHERAARGKREFFESFDFGEAAFEDDPPYLAIVGNITGAGGVDAWGGYRLRMAYANWLQDLVDPRTDYRELNCKDGSEDIFVEAWKRVENIGVNIQRNFIDSFLFTDVQLLERDQWKGIDPRIISRYGKLFGFLYDRYLDAPEGVGAIFKEGLSRDQYIEKMLKIVTESGVSASEKRKKLKPEMYKILSVLLFERSPLEFLTMEKPRLTQNGVTLLSEIQNHFVYAEQAKGGDDKEAAERATRSLDEALNDLVFVEQTARLESIKEMEVIRAERKIQGDARNLYGDLSKLRSEVLARKNGIGGYVINERYIRATLEAQYSRLPEPERNARVERAVGVYRLMLQKLQQPPEHNHTIDTYIGEGETAHEKEQNAKRMREKLEKKEGQMQARMVWWADAWEKNKFGMQFTADTADQFMDRNAAGPDVISNAAEGCANTAEAIQQAFGPGFKDAMKEAALEKQYDKIYAYIKELKGKIEMQDPGLWDTVVGPMMIRRVINTFLQDKKARGFTRSLADTLSGRASSISETYTETEDFHRPWSWDASDVLNFLEGAVGLTSGKVIPKELMKEMRKYSRSLGIDIFLNHFLPIFGMVSIALFVSFMRSAAKENEKNN